MIKWYPWLNNPYNSIIKYFKHGRKHHAILFESEYRYGKKSLFYAISCWLMCKQPNGLKSCKLCHSCKLMTINNHPDYLIFDLTDYNKPNQLGIDLIRYMKYHLYNYAYHGDVKIICIPDSESLTESAVNALLKIIEEPPENSYFLLGCHDHKKLLKTLFSRCLYWKLPVPNESLALCWLQHKNNKLDLLSAITALRLCNGTPIAAAQLLESKLWDTRLKLCKTIEDIIINNDGFKLFPLFTSDNSITLIHWILMLLNDALKWQQEVRNDLVNLDKLTLISTISNNWSTLFLHHKLQQLLTCCSYLTKSSNINYELIILDTLLMW